VVWPLHKQVDIWHAGADVPVNVLGPDDELDDEEVVPGFRYLVARLFV
jgi:hypothetical protein